MSYDHLHADQHAQPPELKDLLKDISIPPRPSSLVDLQRELERDDPRIDKLEGIVNSDVAMSAALLKIANSPWVGLSRSVNTVSESFSILGFKRCQHVLTEIALRKVLPTKGPTLYRFWDVSSKRSQAMGLLASRVGMDSASAQTMGLFADVGIPLLAQRFELPSYIDTLGEAAQSELAFTQVEQDRHGTDHTVIGSLLAKAWGLSADVAQAVRAHHDYDIGHTRHSHFVQELVALCLVADHIIQRFQGLKSHIEWLKGGAMAMNVLAISQTDVDNWADELHDRFATEC
ncbi:MAG: HDOD domain-containing protein [Aquabacterium sp.]|nr:HDOD domain-containing protein [Aquabacterium sp.]